MTGSKLQRWDFGKADGDMLRRDWRGSTRAAKTLAHDLANEHECSIEVWSHDSDESYLIDPGEM